MTNVDLNADLGESFGPWVMGRDEELLQIVTSANVACGFHAGDPGVMRRTVAACKTNGVGIGAHPGFDDLRGFGRRRIIGTPDHDLTNQIIYQIGALQAVAAAEGEALAHVKLHGAFSNMTNEDRALADLFVAAVREVWPDLPVFAVAATHLEAAVRDAGSPCRAEVFADRAYEDNGLLVNRAKPGAVIHDADEAAERVLRMVEERALTSVNGVKIPCEVDTICVHGDTAEAVAMAAAVRTRLEAAGITVARG